MLSSLKQKYREFFVSSFISIKHLRVGLKKRFFAEKWLDVEQTLIYTDHLPSFYCTSLNGAVRNVVFFSDYSINL